MITVRQIERLWEGRAYDRLVGELLSLRIEDSTRLRSLLSGSLPAAAMGLIRLDELNQSHHPIAQKLIRRLLASQAPDGGWEDPLITALCIRALLTSNGQGPAIERAIRYLADLQKSDGAWPKEPIRRLAADSFTTVFILFELTSQEPFRAAVRLDDAIRWVQINEGELDEPSKKLWRHVAVRVGAIKRSTVRTIQFGDAQQALIWS